jgi:hypothetical protein
LWWVCWANTRLAMDMSCSPWRKREELYQWRKNLCVCVHVCVLCVCVLCVCAYVCQCFFKATYHVDQHGNMGFRLLELI